MSTASPTAARLRELDARKKDIEAQLDAGWRRLQEIGIDLDTPMVDAEGFPRSDIDVREARMTVSSVRMLKNDLKQVMKEIEEALHQLHAEARQNQPSESPAQPAANGSAHSAPAARAFLEVREVSPGSPAAAAGLHVGDKILALGSLSAGGYQSMADVARVVQHSARKTLEVLVRRGGSEELRLELTPAPWAGQGLVGCLLVPIQQ